MKVFRGLFLVLVAGIVFAQSVPGLINYQGRLTNDSGQPLDGETLDLTFSFYGVESGGTAYLSVLQEDVEVTKGIYHVLIGSGTITPGTENTLADVFQKHKDVWLGIKVDSDSEMTPRSKITSVPYALTTDVEAMLAAFEARLSSSPDRDSDGHKSLLAGGEDCNDSNSSVYPGASELCDGMDNQCPGDAGYGFLDENCPGGPEWPVLAGNYASYTASFATDVYVSGNYAYVTSHTALPGELEIIDVSDPSSPTLAGGCSVADAGAEGVYVKDNYAYIAYNYQGLQIVDVSNPSSPTLTGNYSTSEAYEVHVRGNYAYVADRTDGLVIINVSNPSSPVLAGDYGSLNNARDIYVKGDYAYIADDSGLRIINVSDKSSPTLAGSYAISSARHIHVDGDYAYVSDGTGLKIVNISDPYSPAFAGQYDTPGFAWGVYAIGNYAYLTDLNAVFQCFFLIINVSDPASPTLAGQYDYPTPDTMDIVIYVSGDYAYVVHYEGAGLQIIRVMNSP